MLKKYKPITPSLRSLVGIDRSLLWKGRPVKSQLCRKYSTGGRNNFGRITAWHKGGGHKKLYRIIDFKRNLYDKQAAVKRIEYDPNRSAFIALIEYSESKKLSYIICPDKLSVGDAVVSSLSDVEIKPGNSTVLENMPIGTLVHNIEFKPKAGGKIARSAGSYAKLMGKSDGYARLEMKSSEVRLVPLSCMATVGIVSNENHQHTCVGKAGRSRWMGKRPVVRGVVMNPIDHPHGGGEGKSSGGRLPVTPWGQPTKGKKTRHNNRTQKFIVKNRKRK